MSNSCCRLPNCIPWNNHFIFFAPREPNSWMVSTTQLQNSCGVRYGPPPPGPAFKQRPPSKNKKVMAQGQPVLISNAASPRLDISWISCWAQQSRHSRKLFSSRRKHPSILEIKLLISARWHYWSRHTERRRQHRRLISKGQLQGLPCMGKITFLKYPVFSTRDTSTGSSLEDRWPLRPIPRKTFRPAVKVRLKLALNQTIRMEGTIKLVDHFGDIHGCIAFGIVDYSVLQIVVDTSYIDWFIAFIFTLEWRIIRVQSRPVALLASYSYNKAIKAMFTDYANNDYNDARLTNKHKVEQTNSWSITVRT